MLYIHITVYICTYLCMCVHSCPHRVYRHSGNGTDPNARLDPFVFCHVDTLYLQASALFNTKIFTYWPSLCSDPFVFCHVDTLYCSKYHYNFNIVYFSSRKLCFQSFLFVVRDESFCHQMSLVKPLGCTFRLARKQLLETQLD